VPQTSLGVGGTSGPRYITCQGLCQNPSATTTESKLLQLPATLLMSQQETIHQAAKPNSPDESSMFLTELELVGTTPQPEFPC